MEPTIFKKRDVMTLNKVLRVEVRRNGIVESIRGIHGRMKEDTLAEVHRVVEANPLLPRCFLPKDENAKG